MKMVKYFWKSMKYLKKKKKITSLRYWEIKGINDKIDYTALVYKVKGEVE